MQFFIQLLNKSGLFLLFLILQGISLFLISRQSNLGESLVGKQVLQVSGWTDAKSSYLRHFFTLGAENKKLVEANAKLEEEIARLTNNEKLKAPFSRVETTDSVNYKFDFLPVKVINNTIIKKNNFLTINRGNKNGVHKGMGVVSDVGVIGRVEYVSNNYARVRSLLNSKSKVNAQIKGRNQFGTLIWDSRSPKHAVLTELSKFIETEKGDTIETYGGRSIFPRFHPIGVIDSITTSDADGLQKIRVLLFEDFSRLQYAYVVKNVDYEEIIKLEELTTDEESEKINQAEIKAQEEEEKRKAIEEKKKQELIKKRAAEDAEKQRVKDSIIAEEKRKEQERLAEERRKRAIADSIRRAQEKLDSAKLKAQQPKEQNNNDESKPEETDD